MKLPAKTVPAKDGGTIPLRASTNPVIGVYLHHCGSVASVHHPKGKRRHTFYLICEECGTDQCGGKAYQEKIAANKQPNIEALQKTCNTQGECVVTKSGEKTPSNDTQKNEQNNLIGLNKAESLPVENAEVVKPMETAKTAVYSPKQADPLTEILTEVLTEQAEPVKPMETAKAAVQTETTYQPEQVSPEKATRVGLFALIGAGLGALLAIR